jgi:hypothetical protein
MCRVMNEIAQWRLPGLWCRLSVSDDLFQLIESSAGRQKKDGFPKGRMRLASTWKVQRWPSKRSGRASLLLSSDLFRIFWTKIFRLTSIYFSGPLGGSKVLGLFWPLHHVSWALAGFVDRAWQQVEP